MRLSVNLDTHEITTTPSALKFKGASTEPVEIVFAPSGGSPVLLAAGAVVELGIINTAGIAIAYSNAFSVGSGNVYSAGLDCSGETLLDLLATTSPQKFNAEVAWGVGAVQYRSATFQVSVEAAQIPNGPTVAQDPTLYPPIADIVTVESLATALSEKENDLGNPDTNGKVLSSTTAGVRSWVPSSSSTSVKSVTVADQTALFALTSADVNLGDLVVVTTGISGGTEFYEVINLEGLASYVGYAWQPVGSSFGNFGNITTGSITLGPETQINFPDETVQTTAFPGAALGSTQALGTGDGVTFGNITIGASGILTFADTTAQTTAFTGLPQSLGITDSPQFANLTLGASGVLTFGDSTSQTTAFAGLPQSLGTSDTPTFAALTLGASGITFADASVQTTAFAGLPQSLGTADSPTFEKLILGAGYTMTINEGVMDINGVAFATVDTTSCKMIFSGLSITANSANFGSGGTLTVNSSTMGFFGRSSFQSNAIADAASDGSDVVTQLNALLAALRTYGLLP